MVVPNIWNKTAGVGCRIEKQLILSGGTKTKFFYFQFAINYPLPLQKEKNVPSKIGIGGIAPKS